MLINGEKIIFYEDKTFENLTNWLNKILFPENNEITEESQIYDIAEHHNTVILLVPDYPNSLAVEETISAFNSLIPKF